MLLFYIERIKPSNHKGAQALRNSPGGYFSAVARLQGWLFTLKDAKKELNGFNFVHFVHA
jgi:hypothetical protein